MEKSINTNFIAKEENNLQQLKRKVKKIEALADFYDDMENRQSRRYSDTKDAIIKTDFAKKQIITICEEAKRLINDTQRDFLQARR